MLYSGGTREPTGSWNFLLLDGGGRWNRRTTAGNKEVEVVKYDPTRTALYRPGVATEFFMAQAAGAPAALCAELSRLAYCEDRRKLERELARAGFSVVESFDERGSQAILAADENRAVLAFRGTEGDDPTDIISDALFLPEDWAPDQ